MAAEYEVNIKINSQEIERELGKIDRTVAKIGKPKGGGSRRKPGIAGLLPSSEELRAAEKGLVQLTAKTKNIQSIQDKFSQRRTRALARSNALNEKDLKLNRQLTAEARARLRLLSQAGAKSFDRTRPQGRQLADDINARAKAQERSSSLANKINELEAKGVDVARQRKQLGKVRQAQADGLFAVAQKEARLLNKNLQLEQSKLRVRQQNSKVLKEQQQVLQGIARAGIKPDSVFGPLRQLGQASMVAGANEAKLLAGRFRAPSSPLTARPVTRASAAQAAQQVEELVRARAALEKQATDDAAAYKMRADKRVLRAQLDLDRIEFKNKIDDIVEATNFEIKEGNRAGRAFDKELKRRASVSSSGLTGQTSPIRGGIFQKGSPNQKRFENVALGAGFPLLFGGGAGSVLGGGLGGFTGSFGAQIILSALGGQLDNFFTAVEESANRVSAALDGTSASLEAVKETGIAVQSSTIEYIQQLEDSGRSLDAYNAVQRELNSIYGVEGITVLQELKGANKFANTEAGKLTAVLQTELAPVFILLAQLGGGAARGIREIIPAIADAIGEFTLGIPGATTTAQLSRKLPGSDPALIAAGERQRAEELRTDAEIETITAGTEALRRQAQIVQLNNDLTDERVVALRKAEITTKAQNEITALSAKATKDIFNTDLARLTQAEIQKVRQQETLDLARLEVSTREAIAAKVEKAAAEQERAARAAQRAADKAEKARMKELQDRIDIASRERQKELDLEASFQDRIKSIGDQNTLLRGQLEGDEDRVRKQLQINNLVDKFGEDKRGQIELLINEQYQLKEQIRLLTEQERLYAEIGQTIQSGIVSGIQGAIDGSKSLQESLSGILKQLGGIFLRTAIGAPGSGGQAGTGLFGALGFASGGFVSGATPAVVGEAGPEYIIPESKMRSAMSRYSRGARGSAVIPEGGGGGTSGEGGGTAVAAPIDVRFNVERINNVDYVTAEQFQVGLQRAAQQGAAEGERRAMGSLRNSAAVRRRIGV